MLSFVGIEIRHRIFDGMMDGSRKPTLYSAYITRSRECEWLLETLICSVTNE
jgi:hypothetical protein